VLEEGGVGETATPLDGIIPDLAEPIIRGNHIIFYNVDEMGDVVRAHSVVYNSIRFESANVDKPIINLHNTSQTVNSIIYNSVIEFKDCTISQLEIGATTAFQAIACPPENMFSRLSLTLNSCNFMLVSNECFLFSSNTTDPEGVAANIFNFEDCKCFNFQDVTTSPAYMQINGCNVWVEDCRLGYLSYFFNSENQSCFFLGQNSSLVTVDQHMFIETSIEGSVGTEIDLNKCQLYTGDPGEDPIKEYFFSEFDLMSANLTDCTLINRPTSLVSGLVTVSINNTQNTSSAYTGDISFDGVKIIGGGTASGDNAGYSTMELVPDNDLYGNNQYLIVDPTGPNHIHIRAGGTQDASTADLFLGGERTGVQVSDATGDVNIRSKNPDQVNIYANSNGTSNTQFIHATGADIIVGDTVRLYAGGDLFTVTSVTPDSPGAGSMTVVADGLTFITGESYNFYRSQGENIWQFDSDRKLNFPGYQNSQSFNNSNGSLEIVTATSGTAWTGNKYHSTVKLIIQGEYSGVSDYEVQSCEVLLVRSSGTVVNHITYGTVYTHDPLFTVTSSVDGGSGDTVLEVNNLTAGNLYISTFATTLGSRD